MRISRAFQSVAMIIALSAMMSAEALTVAIDPVVPKPQDMFFLGKALSASFLVGGGVFAGVAGDNQRKRNLMDRMAEEHIDISDLVLQQTRTQLKDVKGIEALDAEPSDAKLSLEVTQYGFNKKFALSSTLYPTIRLKMSLKKANGDVIWKDSEYVSSHAFDGPDGATEDEMQEELSKLGDRLDLVAKTAVSRLMKEMETELAK